MRLLPKWSRTPPPVPEPELDGLAWASRFPFADPPSVADALSDRIGPERRAALTTEARNGASGRVLAFGRWTADFGDPIDWCRHPTTGRHWDPEQHWSLALAKAHEVGDPKLTWEVARFPQAYAMARAAAFDPELVEPFAAALLRQMEGFLASNPPGRGVHWASGQETAIRAMAWVFAFDTLVGGSAVARDAAPLVARVILLSVQSIERVLEYAERAIYNNHLLNEALGLYLAGVLLPGAPGASAWRTRGLAILDAQAERQFYPDGGYIQLSHNYHRVVLQLLLWASILARSSGGRPSPSWLAAMERSLSLLVQHQCDESGRLPNFGANDGSLPSVLSTCDRQDFRPTLQAVSALVHGERLYDAGPWDEEAAWLLGPAIVDLPLRPPVRRTISFGATGLHVLRPAGGRGFVSFRCGTMRDRFGQIDMLHADVWWRGMNVAVDGGTYLYGGSHEWHDHFMRTASHNIATLDGRDQMLHFRQFKFLYPARARITSFQGDSCAGEHDGYARHAGKCIHHRAVATVGELVVVVDRVTGEGEHDVRIHWLLGDFPHAADTPEGAVVLTTPEGAYAVALFDDDAVRAPTDVARGVADPPRGWYAPYYGEKLPVPSLAMQARTRLPRVWITVMGPGKVTLERKGDIYVAACDTDRASFRIEDGRIDILEDV